MLSTRRVSNLHFWPPTPPPKNNVLDPRGGVQLTFFYPPSPYKNVSYIFWPPPGQQGVKGVGCYLYCFTCLHNAFMHVDMCTPHGSRLAESCVEKKCRRSRLTQVFRSISRAPLIRGKLPQSGSGACAFAKSRSVCRTAVLCIHSVYRTCGGNL